MPPAEDQVVTPDAQPASDTTASPFLKWAGGKRWLVNSHPDLLNQHYTRYVEPFLGGAAVFFHITPPNALLSDINADLIDCYHAIKCDWRSVQKILKRHHRNHCKSYYYKERKKKRRSLSERAAQFIYLNRTCWNGLYRVNLKGEFNVPIGTKSNVIFETEDFSVISNILKRATLKCQDFAKTINSTREGDFLFIDPPYTVRHNINGFLKYNEKIFSWKDQLRLHKCLLRAKERGVTILVLNANHDSIRSLYAGFGTSRILTRHSILSANPIYRRKETELAIVANGRNR